jgi:hypothetical protein
VACILREDSVWTLNSALNRTTLVEPTVVQRMLTSLAHQREIQIDTLGRSITYDKAVKVFGRDYQAACRNDDDNSWIACECA